LGISFCVHSEHVRRHSFLSLNRLLQPKEFANVKNNNCRFRSAATSVFREQFTELRSPIYTEQFRRSERHAPKNDCGKWQRVHESRSQSVDWDYFRLTGSAASAFRRRSQFFLSHSCF